MMPLRRTAMVPCLAISPWRRARNLRRVGQSSVEAEGGGGIGLGGVEEGAELDEVDAVLAVVVVMVAGGPAYAAVGAGGGSPTVPCREGGSQGSPVRALQMRRSRPRSVRSVVMGGGGGGRPRIPC